MMRRTLLILAAVSVAALGVGCTEDQDSILLVQGAALPTGSNGACTADPTGTIIPQGTLDVTLSAGYVAYPVIENVGSESASVGAGGLVGGGQQAQPGVFNGLDVEGNTVLIEEATISYEVIAGSGSIGGITVPASGAIKPGETATVAVALLNSEQAAGLGDGSLIVANIQFSGTSTSGTAITSSTFRFPIEVCAGCLDLRDPVDCTIDPNICQPGQNVPAVCADSN